MSEVPTVSGLAGLTADAFGSDGPLARTLPDFEPRAGQVDMAARVARVFEDGGVLLAEAGTGTGKTLAYLVPAILSRQRVLISTGTKNLQEQIFFKDIPALRQALDVPFTATYMKGRANYLCLHRLDQLNDSGLPAMHDVFLPIIREWSGRTETGDRAELEDLPEDLPFWNEVSATAETCLGTECPRYDDCFVTRMRQRAAASDVVIVNHHLLCADAAVRKNAYGEVIPACNFAVVDEAHQLEDIATQYFGRRDQQLPDRGLRTRRRTSRAVGRVDNHQSQTDIEKGLRQTARPRAHVFQRAGVRPSDQRSPARRGAGAHDRRLAVQHARSGGVRRRGARRHRSDAGVVGQETRGRRCDRVAARPGCRRARETRG